MWKSKGLSGKSIKPTATSDNSLYTIINYIGFKLRITFHNKFLKEDKVTFNHKTVVNFYVFY